MWDPVFFDGMPTEIGFRQKNAATNNRYGNATYAPAKTTRARLQAGSREIRDQSGDTRIVEGVVYCPPGAHWATGARLIATVGGFNPSTDDILVLDDGREVTITLVNRVTDDDGLHHLKVYYG